MLQSFVNSQEVRSIENEHGIRKEITIINPNKKMAVHLEDHSDSDNNILKEIKKESRDPPRIDTSLFIDEPSECFDEFIFQPIDQNERFVSPAETQILIKFIDLDRVENLENSNFRRWPHSTALSRNKGDTDTIIKDTFENTEKGGNENYESFQEESITVRLLSLFI